MADFTSVTTTGVLNDGATWGNVSPGVAGTDYPGVDGDTFTVSAGHTVTYDAGDSTVNFGSATLDGKLSFPATQNSTLNFDATGVLTINSTGELEIGTASTPINKAYHCRLYWAQGASARNVLILNNGGKLSVYGDHDYYGNTRKLILDNSWDASAGDTLYVTGDQTATWPVGLKFWLCKGYAPGTYPTSSTAYQVDSDIFEIASVGAYDSVNDRTPITVVAGHGSTLTFLSGQTLLAVSRNVEFADPGASWDVYGFGAYTETLQFQNNQSVSNYNINLDNCIFRGWYCGIGYYGYHCNNTEGLVFLNCKYAVRHGYAYNLFVDFISCDMAARESFAGSTHIFVGDIVSCACALYNNQSLRLTGNLISNNVVSFRSSGNKIIGDLLYNYKISDSTDNVYIKGNISSAYYITDNIINRCLIQSSDISSYNLLTDFISQMKGSVILEDCMLDGADQLPLRIYANCGNFLPLVSSDTEWQSPPSSNDWILQATPNSYCSTDYATQMELSPKEDMAGYAGTNNTKIRFNIYPVGWSSLDQDDILIEANYLDNASGNSRTTVQTGTVTFTNDAWNELTVDIVPAQDGTVYFNLYIRKYEAGAYVLIDPVWKVI